MIVHYALYLCIVHYLITQEDVVNHSNIASGDVAFQYDISVAIHVETDVVPRLKRSYAISRIISRQSADIDARQIGARLQCLDENIVARLDSFTHVAEPIPDGHKDVVACRHASGNAVERAVLAVDYNIMCRISVPKQIHILVGFQN